MDTIPSKTEQVILCYIFVLFPGEIEFQLVVPMAIFLEVYGLQYFSRLSETVGENNKFKMAARKT